MGSPRKRALSGRQAVEDITVQGVQKRRRGLGWPTASTSLPTLSPELPAGFRPATLLLHTLLPPVPRPLPTSAPSLGAQPCCRRALDAPRRWAAGERGAGGRTSRERRGRRPARGRREAGRGGREREKEGPEGVSSQPVGGDRQVSAWCRDGSIPWGSETQLRELATGAGGSRSAPGLAALWDSGANAPSAQLRL